MDLGEFLTRGLQAGEAGIQVGRDLEGSIQVGPHPREQVAPGLRSAARAAWGPGLRVSQAPSRPGVRRGGTPGVPPLGSRTPESLGPSPAARSPPSPSSFSGPPAWWGRWRGFLLHIQRQSLIFLFLKKRL